MKGGFFCLDLTALIQQPHAIHVGKFIHYYYYLYACIGIVRVFLRLQYYDLRAHISKCTNTFTFTHSRWYIKMLMYVVLASLKVLSQVSKQSHTQFYFKVFSRSSVFGIAKSHLIKTQPNT